MSPEVGFHGYHHVCPFSAHTPQLYRRPQRKDKLPLANFRQRREAASAPQDFPFDHKHRRAESQHCVLGRPSEPGRRTTSTARNASQQNSISASTPRQYSLGITAEAPSGIPLCWLAHFESQ